ncbi:MAG: tetratricopeptide repeat protein, partial [Stackebrandtia sp.]
AMAELARLCGRLPLALAVAGARLRVQPQWSASRLVERLRAEEGRLAELEADDRAVRASFGVGYRAVADDPDGEQAARMFRLLGLHPGTDFSAAVAAALIETTSERAEHMLGRLVDVQLVEAHQTGRYRLHDLLRLYARERAFDEEAEPQRAQAIRRITDSYVATARNALHAHRQGGPMLRERLEPRELASPGVEIKSKEEAYAWLVVELDNLLAAIRESVKTSACDSGIALATTIAPMLRDLGHWHQQLIVGEIVVPVAQDRDDARALFFVRHDLASVQRWLGRLDDALRNCEQNVDLCRRHGLRTMESVALNLLGEIHRLLKNFDAAVEHLRASLVVLHEHGEGVDESIAYMRLGLVCQQTERFDEALDAHRRALRIAQDTGDEWNEASALGNVGATLQQADRPDEAVSHFEQALSRTEQARLGDTALAAEQHWGYGDALYDLSRRGSARDRWNKAASILHRIGLITAEQKAAIAASSRPTMPSVLEW